MLVSAILFRSSHLPINAIPFECPLAPVHIGRVASASFCWRIPRQKSSIASLCSEGSETPLCQFDRAKGTRAPDYFSVSLGEPAF